MKTSEAGINLIKQFEGFSEKPYDDVVGKKTIGWGHLIKPGESFSTLSDSEATELLVSDLSHAEDCIETFVDVELSQHEYDALVSFIFNLGCGAFKGSTLCRLLNNGDKDGASKQFSRWCKAGGKEVAGLTRRRLAEQALFND